MGRIDAWLFAAAPARRLAAVRMLVGTYLFVYLVIRADYLRDLARLPSTRFDPVGPLGFLDSPLDTGIVDILIVATLAATAAFTTGSWYRVAGPLTAVTALTLTTYGQSWGQVFHTENLVVLHVVVLAVAPAADAWSYDARRSPVTKPPEAGYGWALQLATAVTVATYVLAGIAKLRNGGFDWLGGDVLRNLVAHDNLRKILLDEPHSPFGGWLVSYGWVFPLFAIATLVVELGAPAALFGGRWRTGWIVAAWGFHLAVLALMAVFFPYPLFGVAFASMLRAERFIEAILDRLPHRRAATTTLPAETGPGGTL